MYVYSIVVYCTPVLLYNTARLLPDDSRAPSKEAQEKVQGYINTQLSNPADLLDAHNIDELKYLVSASNELGFGEARIEFVLVARC